ncbi:MAG: hypothetical protein HFJ27_02755 [Clostridia bacterium]|nr:hypothetical protein [Clostridia bacterium]
MENEILKEILTDIKGICTQLNSIDERQSYLSKQFDISYNEQVTFRDEQIAFRNEFNTFRDEVIKQLTDLRTDVDTIYVLEKDSRKTLAENTKLLQEHSEILCDLLTLAKVNQEQHENFDKQISFLEAIVS